MAIVELKNIIKYFKDGENYIKVLKDINLEIEKGELVAIMGPSGSGKSTLLNILGFMDKPTSGTYILDGKHTENLSSNKYADMRSSKVSFIFQDYNLLDDYTVYDNVELPLIHKSISKKDKKKLIVETLEKLDIEEKINIKASKLSGGQRQRVAIARALVTGCEVILADEPTGALDQERGQEIMELIIKLNREGKTVIIVTHDPKIANQCNRTLNIVDGVLKY